MLGDFGYSQSQKLAHEIEVGEGRERRVDGDVRCGFRREVAAPAKRDVVIDQ